MGDVWETDRRRRQKLRRILIARDGPWCALCHQEFPEARLTVDHVITRQQIKNLGLSNDLYWDPDNARLACVPCNSRRGARARKRAAAQKPSTPSETAPGW